MSGPTNFARRFLPVWAVGLVGVAGLLLQAPPAALVEQVPQLRALPDLAVRALLLANPLVLVTAMAAVGAALAHRAGLRSALAGDLDARPAVDTALLAGSILAIVLVAIDAAVAPRLGPAWQRVASQASDAPALPALLTGVLYGGIAEEVIMRWGLMSLVVWGVRRLQQRYSTPGACPSTVAAWIGIVVAAAVFAAGHLPALAHSVELNGPIAARTLGLNMLAGIAYGWLYWRRSLETAMLAHATTHVGLALGRMLD